MKKLKIGIDIDDVLSDTSRMILAKFNESFGKKFVYEQMTDYYKLDEKSGVDTVVVNNFFETIIYTEEFHLTIPVFKEAASIIKKWVEEGHEIHYITARRERMRKVTKNWLSKHGFLFENVRLNMYDESLHESEPVYKKDMVEKNKIDVMIEDNLKYAVGMKALVLLPDKPWNRKAIAKNIKRVGSWEEIELSIRGLAHGKKE